MRLDDDQDVTFEEMLADAHRFPLASVCDLTEPAATIPSARPAEDQLPRTIVVPDSCLRLVEGPLVGI